MKLDKLHFLAVALLTNLAINAFLQTGKLQAEIKSEAKPNIIFIVTDDQNYMGDEGILEEVMPNTYNEIFKKGHLFTKAYITTPNCCPSRSSILTGLYASQHKVLYNKAALEKTTLPQVLQSNGYKTGIFGKYLNSWPGDKRAEFDKWFVTVNANRYIDPILNNDGTWERHKGYISTILVNQVNKFIDKQVKEKDPFFVLFTPNAPHLFPRPDPRDAALFEDVAPYRPKNYNRGIGRKPRWVRQSKKNFSKRRQKINDKIYKAQLKTLYSLDREIGRLLDKLEEHSLTENTIIFFISDNGYLLGEFGLDSKQVPYETAIHIPFAVKYPKLIKKALVDESLVANIDMAPTVYDLSDIPPPYELNGLPLTSLFKNDENTDWRTELLIEGAWQPKKRRRQNQPPFYAVHTGEHIYIRTVKSGNREMYDLKNDPFQMNNLARRAPFIDKYLELQKKLADLRIKYPAPLLNKNLRPIGITLTNFKKANESLVQRVVE